MTRIQAYLVCDDDFAKQFFSEHDPGDMVNVVHIRPGENILGRRVSAVFTTKEIRETEWFHAWVRQVISNSGVYEIDKV